MAGTRGGDGIALNELQALMATATRGVVALSMLRGFKLDTPANGDLHRVFFSAKCDCGTAALLNVEVARDKTRGEVEDALPGLVAHLQSRLRQFQAMPCEMHTRMRTSGLGGPPRRPGGESGVETTD